MPALWDESESSAKPAACWANEGLAWEPLLAATRDWRDSRGGEGTEKTFAGYTIQGHRVVSGRRFH